MTNIYFKYKEHPADLLRSTDIVELPNPEKNLEEFLVWFLENYQSNESVAYLDDLYKLLYNEFTNEGDRATFIEFSGKQTEQEIKEEIGLVEQKLKKEAYQNFYELVQGNKIEVEIHLL